MSWLMTIAFVLEVSLDPNIYIIVTYHKLNSNINTRFTNNK